MRDYNIWKKRDVSAETGIDWSKLSDLSDEDIDGCDAQTFIKSHFGATSS